MNNRLNIAIIGLSGLEAIGMRTMIHEEYDAKVESFLVFSDFRSVNDERDAYVVSTDVFVSGIDFFLPRKQKLLVVGRNKEYAVNDSGILKISADSDESEMKRSLDELFRSIQEREPQHGNLSAREIEVLKLISSGKINKEIADELCISVNTVITHRKNISSKLGIKSASGLSLYAVMNGII